MTGPEFEHAVRTAARALWDLSPGEGAAENINSDEIDCVARTEELVHLIECTTERTMEKFRTQVSKLRNAKDYLERRGDTIKLRIVTRDEPTPDQRSFARGQGITAVSLREFQKDLLNSQKYLEARWQYRFGSAVDPESGGSHLSDEEYIPQPLMRSDSTQSYSIKDICDLLLNGTTVVLFGPFGAGKSLTVREIFHHLRREHHRNRIDKTPVAINLRDHWGQSDIDEILLRHAQKVGFEKPHQLVRAWNAGHLIPLLDGIDELASPVMAMGPDAIRRSREEALKVIQAFMRDARGRTGVLLAGRDHYFDSIHEAHQLMRIPADTVFVNVGEFSEEQATEYLRKKGITSPLPTWLPRKPLLLGYLASRGLLDEVTSMPGDSGSALAWDRFLDRISEREAALSADIDGNSVRRLLEDLATRTRARPRGSGPLYDGDLSSAYKGITGYDPSEAARTMLQRLPGLTARDQEIGARSFVDDEMMDALRAGSVSRFVMDPYASFPEKALLHPLSAFGCSVARHLAVEGQVTAAQYRVAASEAMGRWNEPTLALDVMLTGACSDDGTIVDAQGLTIKDGLADCVDMEDNPIKNLTLNNCHIDVLRFDNRESNIIFRDCQIVKLEGIASSRGLPDTIMSCDVGEFDAHHTNAAIAESELPNQVKAFLIMVRKLFLQRGSGRMESALYRGIDHSLRAYIEPMRIYWRRKASSIHTTLVLQPSGMGTVAIGLGCSRYLKALGPRTIRCWQWSGRSLRTDLGWGKR